MNRYKITFITILLITLIGCSGQDSIPPFEDTLYMSPDILTSADPTSFLSNTYSGTATRTMFDRRVNDYVDENAFIFSAAYDDGYTIEIQVNPEFSNSSTAKIEADFYASAIGQLPLALRYNILTVWIHKGTQKFGSGNQNLLIHTGQADIYKNDGVLEEKLVQEAVHTSADSAHATSAGWKAAQTDDNIFISTYAKDNPISHDLSESFLTYIAVRYKSHRISTSLELTISHTIPNRLDYFDINASASMHPIK